MADEQTTQTEPQQEAATDTQPQQPQQPEAPQTSAGETEGTFTQAEVDRIVGERAKRAQEAAVNKLLQDLGFEDAGSLKSLVSKEKERQEAELSAAEKAQKETDKLRKQLEDAEKLRLETEAKYRRAGMVSALKDAATGVQDFEGLMAVVDAQYAEQFADAFDDDGQPIKNKLEKLVKSLQTDKKYFFATPGAGSPSNQGGRAVDPTKESDKKIQQSVNRLLGSSF